MTKIACLLSFVFLFASLATEARLVKGPSKKVGHGRAYAWVEYDSHDKPAAIGVTLTKNAMHGLSSHHTREYVLSHPRVSPYDHVRLNWNPMGHMPDHVYDRPHFDVHFHFSSKAKVSRITCRGSDRARCESHPSGGYVPYDYIPTPGGEPRMGAHWIDPTSDEFNGQLFTKTFIYGSYDGRFSFFEPMVTRDYLLSRPDFLTFVKEPNWVDRSGWYPNHYQVKYDSSTETYSIALRDFEWKDRH